jgi:hypothetical protein
MENIRVLLMLLLAAVGLSYGFQLPTETYDEYPWMSCNSFEATRKNCPRGEACLKLKQYQEYAWSWAMKCQSREESIAKYDFNINSLK